MTSTCRPTDIAEVAAKQIDESVKRFMEQYSLDIDKLEPELILAGGDVVDNGVNKAIVDQVNFCFSLFF